ncbi:hypothetical protein [Frigoriflavimonas asaccharolytica]|uniref:Uncharacterized protein n=1 Tax=Frigoriflavimonas asaccharolytica TaxID=2735899 RepID=A0A8J8K859_9FLAO|nr:hypothetical protein [Frigoriflavimonas asaccharolytica]NRS91607.1 hypothetical protein [Frigoriflavimonas asaccharolytica]
MEIPTQIRIRLLFTFGKEIFYKFYWFEMKDDDFYWGSAYQANYSEKTSTSFNKAEKLSIQVPEDFNKLVKNSGKYSYHEDGQVHFKINLKDGSSNYKNLTNWPLKDEISKPTRFFTVLSRTLKHYNKEIENLTKTNSNALVINFPEDVKDKRVYFEFFLSPLGNFPIPETLLKINGDLNDIIQHTISPNLILLIRHGIFENLNDSHPDKELSIITYEV